jgi:predicted RNA-binding protein Jag
MENALEKTKNMLELMGFEKARVDFDEEHSKMSIFIDDEVIEPRVATTLPAIEHILNLMHKGEKALVVDLNYYRKERERLIAELARAAAKKATVTREEVELPPMNAYERRLVHLEITTHPELKTESVGIGKERHVVIRHLSLS